MPVQEYLTHSAIYTYLFNNTTLIFQPTAFALPYVFDANPYKPSVNGSLWTLSWEINMYILLGMLGSLVFIKPSFLSLKIFKWIIIGIVVISFPLYVVNHLVNFSEMPFFRAGVRFLTLFFIGAILFIFQDKVYLSKRLFGICLLLLFYCANYKFIYFPMYNLLLGYIVLYVAYIPSGFIRNFNKLGDYSYGVYIYAFPIQQSVAALIPNVSVVTMVIYSFLITLMFAICSWHLIEKPALKLKINRNFTLNNL
jgi:peptidoglycan/LPS O-acetylase OafA/YrhL